MSGHGDETIGVGNSPGAFPEVRLKAGFKNPREAPRHQPHLKPPSAAESQPQTAALSIDDMLALTQSHRSATDKPEAPAPSSEASPSDAQAPPPPPEPLKTEPDPPPVTEPELPPAAPPPKKDILPALAVMDDIIAHSETSGVLSPGSLPDPPKATSGLKKLLSAKPSKAKIKALLSAGAALAVVCLVAAPPLFGSAFDTQMHGVTALVESEPRAELFLGQERLGRTPQVVDLKADSGQVTLRMAGYKDKIVELSEALGPKKVHRLKVTLEGQPVSLNWDGLPSDLRLWWDGAEKSPAQLAQASAGKHTIKIKPQDGPSTSWDLTIPWDHGGAYPIGKVVSKELAQRPRLELSLGGASSTTAVIRGVKGYKKTVELSKDQPLQMSLPEPGRYTISAAAGKGLSAYQESLDLQPGKSHKVALNRQAVRAPVATSSNSSGSATRSYTPPPRRTYYPPPSYSGGGGGGGGRIAPPSF